MFCEKCETCFAEYFRTFDIKGVRLQPTGRLCSKAELKTETEENSGSFICNGILRDTILDWEDELPEPDLTLSEKHSAQADLSLCLGTSLQIVPAADIPLLTISTSEERNNGSGKLAIVNLQETPKDEFSDVCIHSFVDEVMYYAYHILGNAPIPDFFFKFTVYAHVEISLVKD